VLQPRRWQRGRARAKGETLQRLNRFLRRKRRRARGCAEGLHRAAWGLHLPRAPVGPGSASGSVPPPPTNGHPLVTPRGCSLAPLHPSACCRAKGQGARPASLACCDRNHRTSRISPPDQFPVRGRAALRRGPCRARVSDAPR